MVQSIHLLKRCAWPGQLKYMPVPSWHASSPADFCSARVLFRASAHCFNPEFIARRASSGPSTLRRRIEASICSTIKEAQKVINSSTQALHLSKALFVTANPLFPIQGLRTTGFHPQQPQPPSVPSKDPLAEREEAVQVSSRESAKLACPTAFTGSVQGCFGALSDLEIHEMQKKTKQA